MTVPLRIQRRFLSTRGVAGDGHHLALFPPLGVVSVIVVTVGFFAAGAFGLGFDDVFSESLMIMASLIALGAFSGQLGLLGLTSFAVSDFFIGQRTWTTVGGFDQSVIEQLIRARVPLIISYLLMAVAVIVIPRLGKNIALGIGQWRRVPTDLAWLVSTPVVIIVSWLGLRTWAAMAPTLMRPYFVWRGGAPTVEAIQVFQGQTSQLVAAGVAATVARQVLNAVFIYQPSMMDRLKVMEARAHARLLGTDGDGRSGQPLELTQSDGARLAADVVSALTASLVMAGILETRLLWFGTFAVFLAVRFLRSGTIRFGLLNQWKVTAARVPVVVRLGCMWLGAALYRTLLTNEAIGSYQAMAFVVIGGVILAFLIFPGQPDQSAERSLGRPSATTIGGVAVLALGTAVIDAALSAGPAAADNCSVFTDCFGQSEAASEAALGLTALAALSLIIDFIGGRGWGGFGLGGRGLFGGDDGGSAWDRALGLIDLNPLPDGGLFGQSAAGLFDDLFGSVPDVGVWSLLNGSGGWLDLSGTTDITANVGGAINHFFGTDVFDGDRWRSFFGELGEGALEISSLQPGSPEQIRMMMSDPGEMMSRYGSFGLGLWDFGSGTAQFVYDVSSLTPASPAWILEANRWLSTGEHRGFQLAGQLAAAGDQLESLNPATAAFYQELGEVIATGSIADHEGLSAAGTMVVGLVDWETFKEDPSRWFGRFTGEAALEVATAGAASGLGLTDNAATAVTRLDDLADPDAIRALDNTAPPSSPFRSPFRNLFGDLFDNFDPFNLNRHGDDLPPPPTSSTLPPLRPEASTPTPPPPGPGPSPGDQGLVTTPADDLVAVPDRRIPDPDATPDPSGGGSGSGAGRGDGGGGTGGSGDGRGGGGDDGPNPDGHSSPDDGWGDLRADDIVRLESEWNIDVSNIDGSLEGLRWDLENAAKPPENSAGVGARGELETIRDAQARGQTVERLAPSGGKTADFRIDGQRVEIKSREAELTTDNQYRNFFNTRPKEAGAQILASQEIGAVELRLRGAALDSFDVGRADVEISRAGSSSRMANVDRLTVLSGDGDVLTEWIRDSSGRWVKNQ